MALWGLVTYIVRLLLKDLVATAGSRVAGDLTTDLRDSVESCGLIVRTGAQRRGGAAEGDLPPILVDSETLKGGEFGMEEREREATKNQNV